MATRHDVKVQKWQGAKPPTEEQLRQKMQAEGLTPYRWSNGSGDVYNTHTHNYHKVLYVVQGTIIFGMPDLGHKVRLNAGDRMELPAHIAHNAVVGVKGVVCLEAHRR